MRPLRLLPLLLLLAPALPAAAQVPPVPATGEAFENLVLVTINVDDVGMKEVPYLGQVTFRCSIEDLSRDSSHGTAAGGGTGIAHLTEVFTEVLPYTPPGVNNTNVTARPIGWAASGGTSVVTSGGQVAPFTVTVKTTGAVVDNYVTVRIVARTYAWGQVYEDTEHLVVKLADYNAGRVLMRAPPPRAGQDETITYPVEVTNFNSYIDTFLLNASAPDGYHVSVPPRVILGPRETRVVNLTIHTPHNYVWDLGTPGMVMVQMRAERDPKVVYTAGTPVLVSGPYLPLYWLPMLVLGIAAGGQVLRDGRERAALRAGEKSLPRKPKPSPKEAAFLAELKRRDPAAYKERMLSYEQMYAERRKDWKEHRREELAREREEARESQALAAERKAKEAELAKARRKLERAKAKQEAARAAAAQAAAAAEAKVRAKEAKASAKAAKRQTKVDAKRAKAEAKQRAKLEKELAKKRKVLEKARRKAEKRS